MPAWSRSALVNAPLRWPKRLDGILDRGVRRDEKHEGFRTDLEEPAEELETVHAGKLYIAERDVEALLAGERKRFLGVAARGDAKALVREVLGERLADEG